MTDNKYYVYVIQAAEGCDYTIACGETLVSLEADTLDDALQEAKQTMVMGYNGPFGEEPGRYSHPEYRLCRAVLIEASGILEIDIDAWYRELDDRNAEILRREQERAERAAYERLKAKYEGIWKG